jgi:hypothetical protein
VLTQRTYFDLIADSLRALVEPQVVEEKDKKRTSKIWDLPNLTSFTTLGRPMRVVWCEEEYTKSRRVGGRKKVVTELNRWIWVTDLPACEVPATTIQRWGHERWNLENRGFNELTKLWGLKHSFVHHPTAILVLLLTLAVAFLVTYLFYERDLKPPARKHLSRLALTLRLLEGFLELAGAALWPALEFSG